MEENPYLAKWVLLATNPLWTEKRHQEAGFKKDKPTEYLRVNHVVSDSMVYLIESMVPSFYDLFLHVLTYDGLTLSTIMFTGIIFLFGIFMTAHNRKICKKHVQAFSQSPHYQVWERTSHIRALLQLLDRYIEDPKDKPTFEKFTNVFQVASEDLARGMESTEMRDAVVDLYLQKVLQENMKQQLANEEVQKVLIPCPYRCALGKCWKDLPDEKVKQATISAGDTSLYDISTTIVCPFDHKYSENKQEVRDNREHVYTDAELKLEENLYEVFKLHLENMKEQNNSRFDTSRGTGITYQQYLPVCLVALVRKTPTCECNTGAHFKKWNDAIRHAQNMQRIASERKLPVPPCPLWVGGCECPLGEHCDRGHLESEKGFCQVEQTTGKCTNRSSCPYIHNDQNHADTQEEANDRIVTWWKSLGVCEYAFKKAICPFLKGCGRRPCLDKTYDTPEQIKEAEQRWARYH